MASEPSYLLASYLHTPLHTLVLSSCCPHAVLRQVASLLVKCFPAMPDALGIASALTFELGGEQEPQSRQFTMQLGGCL